MNIDFDITKTDTFYLLRFRYRCEGASGEAIYHYMDYCKSAGFLHMVSREDIIGRRLLQFQEKIYIADHGIREAIYGNNLQDINQTLENIVYMELLRWAYDVTIGKLNHLEIDFIAASAKNKIYVEGYE